MKRKVIHENFKSLENLIETMETRPLNTAFNGQELSSQNIDERNWSGTKTYNDAMDVIRTGYKDPLERMKKAILKIGEMDNDKRPRMKNDFIGFVPNVPNTLMNLPQTMINRERVPMKNKTIHLTYSFCALADVKANDLIKGGINFISLVNSLEKQGYRVKIDIIFISVSDKTAAAFAVTLKEYGQNLNLLKLAFPLVHPSMLRRIAFKWLETTPTLKDKGFVRGYGQTLGIKLNNNVQAEYNWLKENGILKGPNSYYCNVYQAFRAENIEELAREMALK